MTAATFVVRSTVHLTHQKTPGQLVFGRDTMLNIKHEADWELIRQRKQEMINKNNLRENSRRTPYEYQVGQKVLLKTGTEYKCERPQEDPYKILEVLKNGTVRPQKGPVTDVVNIRRIFPFYERSKSSHGGECSKQPSRSKRRSDQVQNIGQRSSQRLAKRARMLRRLN